MKKVAVIVPVYNTEEYIADCIESLLKQTLKEIQIILVDDGSSDSSGVICDEFSKMDYRICVIHHSNKGQAVTRREGTLISDAEYVTFLDSDDRLDDDYLEKMYDSMNNSHADMVTSEIRFEMGENYSFIKSIYPYGLYDSKELFKSMIYGGEFFSYGLQPHMCSKLFKRDKAIEVFDIISSDVCAGEDALFTYVYVSRSKKICVSDICGYHYIWRSSSLTNSIPLSNDIIKLKNLFSVMIDYFTKLDCDRLIYPQLIQYEKFHLMMRHIDIFDIGDNDKVLNPFGGIPLKSRIVLYGAGVIGQKIYSYLISRNVKIVYWVDRNDIFFKKLGYNVDNPDMVKFSDGDYDFVIIANTVSKIAEEIKKFLLNRGTSETKIRWLDDRFTDSYYSCGILMGDNKNAFTG